MVSNLGKSVSDQRTHDEEALFRNIVSATAKCDFFLSQFFLRCSSEDTSLFGVYALPTYRGNSDSVRAETLSTHLLLG